MDRDNKQTSIHTNNTRSSVSVHRNLSRSWFKQPYNYRKSDRGSKYNRHYINLLAVGITSVFFPSQALANVGGVSATAAPVANSSVVLLQIKRYKFYKVRISPTPTDQASNVKVPLEISPLT